ncbi:MAG: ribosomal protein S18-alanine N-acetyltransferase [Dehalococcoidia bacterium]
MKTATGYYVRPMTVADVDQVSDIDQEAFPTTWPPTAFKRELENNKLARYLVAVERAEEEESLCQQKGQERRDGRWQRLMGGVRRLLGPSPSAGGEHICGYVGVWLMVQEVHIVSIAVRASLRRRGIGELLLIATIDLARALDQEVVSLECRVSNHAALALYDKYGFKRVGIRRRYYSDNHEDALVMTTESIGSAVYQALLQERKGQYQERWGEPRVALI